MDDLYDLISNVKSAIDRVGVDLQAAGAIGRTRVRRGTGESVFLHVDWREGGSTEWEIFGGTDPDVVVAVADNLSNELSTADRCVPACPLHPTHALEATQRDGVAVWICPDSPDVARAIGSLRD